MMAVIKAIQRIKVINIKLHQNIPRILFFITSLTPETRASFYSPTPRWTSPVSPLPEFSTIFSQDHEHIIIEPDLPSLFFEEDEMKQKMAWAKHTVLSVAAAVMNVPTDVFTTPPMVEKASSKPNNEDEKLHREKINTLLTEGFPDQLSGFKIPNEEVQMIHKVNDSRESSHNPSTYGEVTQLGARQLFHYMNMYNDNNKHFHDKIHFIDLGSGNGKLVIQAYLEIPNLKQVEGIELSMNRHNIAIQSWDKIKERADDIRNETIELSKRGRSSHERNDKITDMLLEANNKENRTKINLIQGDLFDMDVSKATHIYVASLCFTEKMMNDLSNKIVNECSDDILRFVATLKPFPSDFEKGLGLKKYVKYVEMSWTKPRGMGGIVYFYSRDSC